MNPPQTLRTKRVGLGAGGGKGDERERKRRRIKGEDGMFSVSGSSVHFMRSFPLSRGHYKGFKCQRFTAVYVSYQNSGLK